MGTVLGGILPGIRTNSGQAGLLGMALGNAYL